jgi:hypothetical protein
MRGLAVAAAPTQEKSDDQMVSQAMDRQVRAHLEL